MRYIADHFPSVSMDPHEETRAAFTDSLDDFVRSDIVLLDLHHAMAHILKRPIKFALC